MTNWKEIHQDFTLESQEIWERHGFDYQDVREWIIDGEFKPDDYNRGGWTNSGYIEGKWGRRDYIQGVLYAKEWRDQGFKAQEVKEWIRIGLDKEEDAEFAAYLKWKGYQPNSNLSWKQIKENGMPAQEYLDCFYPQEQRDAIEKLYINSKNLTGKLDLSDFKNLEELYCFSNKLTSLEINDCSKLTSLNISNNNLSKRDLSMFSHLTDLEYLIIGNNYMRLGKEKIYNRFYGSLEPLRNLNELEGLNIRNTDISHGLEYLPNSIKYFDCSCLERPEAEVNDIWEELLPFEKIKLTRGAYDDGRDDGGLKNWRKVRLDKQPSLTVSPLLPPQLIDKIKKGNKFRENYGIPNTNYNEIHFNQWGEELEDFGKSEEEVWEEEFEELKEFAKQMAERLDIKFTEVELFKFIINDLIEKMKDENLEVKFDETFINYAVNHVNNVGLDDYRQKLKEEIEKLKEEFFPTKLYDVKKEEVELTKGNSDIDNYVILSYVWGNPGQASEEIKSYSWWKEGLNISGNKALYKAVRAIKTLNEKRHKEAQEQSPNITEKKLKELNINHLWIDQLCIDQNSAEDKSQEVPKMRQYYSNADYTLISINTELGDISDVDMIDILKAIVRSEWFTRSWTFQEGWLSKHTIFMFDDKLIDGRAMAGTWALNQLGYVGEGRYNSRREFDKGSKKIATPVGWTYFRGGYDENDKVTMTLSEALKEIKNRGRSIPVDGVYSILGLLPYGEKVEVKYKKKVCQHTEEEQKNKEICQHTEIEKNWPTYTREELEEVLIKVMEVAVKNGYAEPITWHGLGTSWLPQIDEKGSTSIEGGMEIRCYNEYMTYSPIKFSEEGIKLRVNTYQIQELDSQIYKRESGFEVEGGLYERKVRVKLFTESILEAPKRDEIEESEYEEIEKEFQKLKEELEKPIELTLLGTKKVMELIKEDVVVAIPNKRDMEGNVDSDFFWSLKPFGLLLKHTGKEKKSWHGSTSNIYYRLGLVELGAGVEKLKEVTNIEKIYIIDPTALRNSEAYCQDQYQSQIQVDPKGNN